MVVTVDGPAGAGKSTASRALAQRLGFRFLDTGAMYRAVTLAILDRRWQELPAEELAARTADLQIDLQGDRVLLDGRDVTLEIRLPRVTEATHLAADNPGIRQQLVQLQRRLAEEGPVVTEGRDQGTVAFPDADCKVFLSASAEERARRRGEELARQGENADPQHVLQQINARDHRDYERPVGRLARAADAAEILTDGLTLQQVVDRLEQVVRRCQERLG